MSWKDIKKNMARQMSDALEIPNEVMMDLPKIVIIGNIKIFIENHRGIVEYSSSTVRVNVGDREVVVMGEGLYLKNILPDEICVEGSISQVKFLD